MALARSAESFPVGIHGPRCVRLRVRVAFDGNFVGEAAEFAGESFEKILAVCAELGAAAIEKCAGGAFDQLDAEAFGRDRHFDVAFELVEIRNTRDGFFELQLELLYVGNGNDRSGVAADDVLASLFGCALGIAKISADSFLNFLTGVDEPENDKESDHRGNEVRVGDFPRTAVVASVAALFLADD